MSHPLQALALHLAQQAGELDLGTLAQALGQNPAHPSASAYRAVARDTLHRLTAAGMLRRHGTRPAYWWTPAPTGGRARD